MDSVNYKKYLKYKHKSDELNKIIGGKFKTENIEVCQRVSIFCVQLLENLNDDNNLQKLYTENIDLFETPVITTLLSNITYLFDIQLNTIKNDSIRDKIMGVYTKRYYNNNSHQITLDFEQGKITEKCFDNMKTWNTKFFLEDFWSCTIHEFFDEYDKFEETNESYKLFWINLINISNLLCMIKTCRYYFVKIEDSSKVPITYHEYLTLHDNNEILYFDEQSNKYAMTKSALQERKYKFIFTWIKELTNDNIFNLAKTLVASLDCNYNNVSKLYTELICLFIEKEIHNERYRYILLSDLMDMCENIKVGVHNNSYFYLSLNLPKESNYARNEYTKFCCTSINPLNLIDDVPLTITQIVGHDYTFHNMMKRKQLHNESSKLEFRQFIGNVEQRINDKETLKLFYEFLEITLASRLPRILKNILADFIATQKNLTIDELFEEILKIIHFMFHELASSTPFTAENFVLQINHIIEGKINMNLLIKDYDFRLKLIVFIIFAGFCDVRLLYYGNNTIKLLKKHSDLTLVEMYNKNHSDINCSQLADFLKDQINDSIDMIKDWKLE